MSGAKIRRLLVDSPDSLGGRARAKRWKVFRATFPDVEEMRVLDLGGTVESWERSPVRPAEVVVINTDGASGSAGEGLVCLTGDACRASMVLSEFDVCHDFDLVFSNSLIEHVGGHERRRELAGEVRSLAPRHWIQTPYRFFPLEPHWLFPGMQFLPDFARVAVARSWPLGGRSSSVRDATARALGTELLSRTAMRFYFPDSMLWDERVFGLTKSLVAVRA